MPTQASHKASPGAGLVERSKIVRLRTRHVDKFRFGALWRTIFSLTQ
jgi:hypothetical protein